MTPAAPSGTVTRAVSETAAAESVFGPWGFTSRHAPDYIAWRFFERDVTFSATMAGPNGTEARFGDPATSATHAAGLGFKVDNMARAGAIAHRNAGEQGAGAAGHVAYSSGQPGRLGGGVGVDWDVVNGYSQGTLVRAPRYIHIQDL